jgi:hypothetical protein
MVYNSKIAMQCGWGDVVGEGNWPRGPGAQGILRRASKETLRTGSLLLKCQLVPATLHTISQCHPELSLLLKRHCLPSLLDVS